MPTHTPQATDTCDAPTPHGVWALRRALRALVRDEDGQDVIEYGLLSAFFGIVTIAVWISIQDNLRDAYLAYDAGVQNIWQSPDPGGS